MKNVRYRSTALDDLRAIAGYYEDIDGDVALRVRADIEGAIDPLRENPYSAQAVGRRGLRRKTTRRYHFKIAYHVRHDSIEIVGIFRFQNRTA